MSRVRYCERCGSALAQDSRFCENCGAPVGGAARRQRRQGSANMYGQSDPDAAAYQENDPDATVAYRENDPDATVAYRESDPDATVAYRENDPDATVAYRENDPDATVAYRENDPDATVAYKENDPDATAAYRENDPNGAAAYRQDASNGYRQVNPGRVQGSRQGTPGGYGRDEEVFSPRRQSRPDGQGRTVPRYRTQSDMGYSQEDERRRARYRQEELENDWQQSWEREPAEEEEQGFTPLQYVLIGLMVILLIALIAFGAFWILGRSDKKSDSARSGSSQTESVQTDDIEEESAGAIQILDGDGQTKAQTEAEAKKEEEDIVLNYPEFSITLPASWKGKYGITQSGDSYTYYHQASKAQGYGGKFFTLTRYTDTSYKDLPNAQVIGTGNGAAYVYSAPTDVQCPADNQSVADEYKQMSLDFGAPGSRIRMLISGEGPKETEAPQTVEIQQEQQTVTTDGYIAESSQRLLTDSDVAGMSYNDLQMAINEIYARHGRRFASESIQSYFNSQPWYNGTVDPEDFSDSVFSSIEAQNIQFLLKKMGVQ